MFPMVGHALLIGSDSKHVISEGRRDETPPAFFSESPGGMAEALEAQGPGRSEAVGSGGGCGQVEFPPPPSPQEIDQDLTGPKHFDRTSETESQHSNVPSSYFRVRTFGLR